MNCENITNQVVSIDNDNPLLIGTGAKDEQEVDPPVRFPQWVTRGSAGPSLTFQIFQLFGLGPPGLLSLGVVVVRLSRVRLVLFPWALGQHLLQGITMYIHTRGTAET